MCHIFSVPSCPLLHKLLYHENRKKRFLWHHNIGKIGCILLSKYAWFEPWNPRSLCSRFHWIPGALSVGRLSVIKSWFFTPCLFILFWNCCKHFFVITYDFWEVKSSCFTNLSHIIHQFWWNNRYLLTLASDPSKSFFSKFLQHHYHILLDCLMLFFWEHSYCSLVKKHHEKHKHISWSTILLLM